MGFWSKALEWMGEHKIVTGVVGATVGYSLVSRIAKAEPAQKTLPGTNAQQTKSGALVTPTHVVPPPHPATDGPTLYVATHDPAPQGNLNARASSDLSEKGQPLGQIVGYWPKDGPVALLDAGPGNGMVYVRGPGFDIATNQAVTLEGWASSAYLEAKSDVASLLSSFPMEF